MKKLLIVGAGGQLGQLLIEMAREIPDLRVFAYTRSQLDITEAAEIAEAFADVEPDFCINCAAYTAVDRAENEAEKAMQINADGAGALAAASFKQGSAFLHFSTDYVYSDEYNRPLLETDTTDPKSSYARSKLAGEHAVLQAHPHSHIVRTSWVYSEYGQNFVLSMRKLGKERDQLRVVFDQVGTPTYARDLAKASLDLLFKEAAPGFYNYSNSGVTSWYDFCLAIHEMSNIDCAVTPILSDGYPTPAKRPHYSLMDKTKVSEVIGSPRHWKVALKDCLSRMS